VTRSNAYHAHRSHQHRGTDCPRIHARTSAPRAARCASAEGRARLMAYMRAYACARACTCVRSASWPPLGRASSPSVVSYALHTRSAFLLAYSPPYAHKSSRGNSSQRPRHARVRLLALCGSSSALVSALISALISAGCRLPVRRRRVEKARHTQGPCLATCPCTSFTSLHSRPHAPPTHADAACASQSGQVESIDLTTGLAVQRLHTP